LLETIDFAQPSGFIDSYHPKFVCCLNKSLYGLKQASPAWYSRFTTFILGTKSHTSLFETILIAFLLLYYTEPLVHSEEFSMKDLDHLHHFFGMTVSHSFGCLFLSQRHYMLEILDCVGMFDCKPCTTPVDDATHYRGMTVSHSFGCLFLSQRHYMLEILHHFFGILLLMMPLIIVAFLGRFNISLLPGLILLTLCNIFAFTCMILKRLILLLLRVFFAMSKILLTMDLCCITLRLLVSWIILYSDDDWVGCRDT
jgi:hypothetical protein